VRRIPVYSPEWTDHNASDPGITLIELFAFLGENLLFRFNQIPKRPSWRTCACCKCLCGPLCLRGHCSPCPPKARPERWFRRAQKRERAVFSSKTKTEVRAYPVSFMAVARTQTGPPDPTNEPEVHDFALRALDAIGPLPANQKPVYYRNETVPVDGLGLPVDFSASVDGMLWIAVLATKGADVSQMGDAVLNVGFVPDPVVPTMDQIDACPGFGAATTGAAVEWQASTGTFDASGQPVYALSLSWAILRAGSVRKESFACVCPTIRQRLRTRQGSRISRFPILTRAVRACFLRCSLMRLKNRSFFGSGPSD